MMKRLDFGPAWIIARREIRDQLRDWRIIFPVLGLTVFFPFLMNFTAQQVLNFVRGYGAEIVGERLIPFFLMIVGFFPISVSMVIALESFVGEKERMSIEPLLDSPIKDWQLYMGKLLAATAPPLASAYVGMGTYILGLVTQNIPLPEPDMMALILAMTLVQALVMVAGAVVVSSQATSVRAANLLASFIIIPMALLIQAESVIMFWGDYRTLWWVILGLVVLTITFIRVGVAHFQREELLGREIDVLNLKWGWRVFRQAFTGEASSVSNWYLKEIPAAIGRLVKPSIILAVMALIGLAIGYGMAADYMNTNGVPVIFQGTGVTPQKIQKLLAEWPLFSGEPVVSIWWQNVRALLIGMLMGAFTMGILGVFPLLATMALVGGTMAVIGYNDLPAGLIMIGLILPHGVIEVPAAIIACAAVLKSGAILATPSPGKTVGEVWVTALGEWAKIMVGAVIPLLLVAAGIEVWVTPRIASLLFSTP